MDHCDSLELARLPNFADVLHNLKFTSFPVLFPRAVRIFTNLFGTSDASLRCFGFLVHLNHEVRDFELDSHNNARTNAGLLVFGLAYFCLFYLGWFRFLPRPLALLAALLYPLHLYWSLRALRGQLNPQIVDRFQIQYRALYTVIGISMLCSLFYQ